MASHNQRGPRRASRNPNLLTEADAACYIGMSAQWLRLSRVRGAALDAPKYLKMGPTDRSTVLYRRSDLDEWIESRVRIPGEAA